MKIANVPGVNFVEKKTPDIELKKNNWYQSLPYAFRAYVKIYNDMSAAALLKPSLSLEPSVKIFPLPISPNNLTIITHFANNAITTLYSTIEEHSEIRYFDISIQGTTGFAPMYADLQGDNFLQDGVEPGRLSYKNGNIADIAGGFLGSTLSSIQNIANQASTLIGGGQKHQSGIDIDNTGYMAFHKFYRFLRDYKNEIMNSNQSASSTSSSDPFSNLNPLNKLTTNTSPISLEFINYKDNCKYSCIITNFTLNRTADNPMLYNYVIQLRAYNLKPIGYNLDDVNFLQNRMESLGLTDDAKSLASSVKDKIKGGKSVLNSARGLVGGLGR